MYGIFLTLPDAVLVIGALSSEATESILEVAQATSTEAPITTPSPREPAPDISSTVPPTSQIEPDLSPTPVPSPVPPPGMVRVEGGGFLVGSDLLGASRPPSPQHYEQITTFWINENEITNGEYEKCVLANACSPPSKTSSARQSEYFGNDTFSNHPVVWISFKQASDYCKWIGGNLPAEEQWERVARGREANTYPWGNSEPKIDSANFAIPSLLNDVKAIDSFPKDRSPDEVINMAGNVSEWTRSWFVSYEGNLEPFDYTNALRVVRGANFQTDPETNYIKSFFRRGYDPEYGYLTIGFRCVWTP